MPPLPGGHRSGHGVHKRERAEIIRLHMRNVPLEGLLEEQTGFGNSGAAQQQVDRAEVTLDAPDQIVAGRRIADIQRFDDDRIGIEPRKPGDQLRPRFIKPRG
jgi:hypothetical protein